MDQNKMEPKVNLHSERRRRLEATDTSKSSTPSIRHEDIEMMDPPTENEKIEASDASPRKRMRQMRLDFSNGSLATKKPLTNPISRNDDARKALATVADETITLLPGLLKTRPDVGTDGYLCQKEDIDARFCPGLRPIKVRVINGDTINVALRIQARNSSPQAHKPITILNMANAKTAGGGWRHGAMAQEEAICYRTSLSFTLRRDNYPIPDDAVIYSPRVLVIRDSLKDGHQIVDCTEPRKLHVVSVISCAAVCQPSIKKDANTGARTYAVARDRSMMLSKMRVILRTAIRRSHRQLVLGALGCGVFGNPNTEVAAMWKAVLLEPEFSGGWWTDIAFAVMGDMRPDSNFTVFHNELDGLVIH